MVRFNRLLQKGMLISIRAYRYCLSPLLGRRCRFYPSCSEFAQEALCKYGPWKGLSLSVSRILRCHPFHPGGYDPLP